MCTICARLYYVAAVRGVCASLTSLLRLHADLYQVCIINFVAEYLGSLDKCVSSVLDTKKTQGFSLADVLLASLAWA